MTLRTLLPLKEGCYSCGVPGSRSTLPRLLLCHELLLRLGQLRVLAHQGPRLCLRPRLCLLALQLVQKQLLPMLLLLGLDRLLLVVVALRVLVSVLILIKMAISCFTKTKKVVYECIW